MKAIDNRRRSRRRRRRRRLRETAINVARFIFNYYITLL